MPTAKRRERGVPPDLDLFHTWAETCPLWLWREAHGVTRPMAAAILGVNSTSIWQWEHGAVTPKKENMARVVAILGPDAVERWIKWLANKPKVV